MGLLRLAVPVSGKHTQGCAPWLNASTNDEPLTLTSVSQAGDVFPLCAMVQLIGDVTPPSGPPMSRLSLLIAAITAFCVGFAPASRRPTVKMFADSQPMSATSEYSSLVKPYFCIS